MLRKRWVRQKVKGRVNVITHEGVTFSGLLIGEYVDGVALTGCAHYAEDGTPTALSGEILVPKGTVAFIQHEPMKVRSDGL